MINVSQAHSGSERKAFSLLELFIAIAIICLLCALLLPSLTTARQKSKRVRCGSVLHQVYLTSVIYADDNKGKMPSRNVFNLTNSLIARCPSATVRLTSIEHGGYIWSAFVFDDHISMDRLEPRYWMVMDKIPWHDPQRTRMPDRFWEGRVNILRGDGHVAWKSGSTPP